MRNNTFIDRAIFHSHLEKACEAALHDPRAFPCEETFYRASGKLDGLLHGAASVLHSLSPDRSDPSLMEDARTVVERFRKELAELIESSG